ncbi:hypothetical protein BSKO_09568 [Bryopsis sp. KO-2023]|nr:hypothetical protein BSKO_09568 [Bryopsis sp. KO-2023]
MRSPRTRELAAALRGSAIDDDVGDWHSNVSTTSSTVATTASLSSRIAALTIDLEDAARKEKDFEELGTFPEEEEEEEVVEVTEEEVMRMLDSQEDPFQVCSRLFYRKVSNPICLKRLNITHVEEFKQHGYIVLDNFVSREVATLIRAETLRLKQRGRLAEASKMGHSSFQATGARGDSILWLHLGKPPMVTPAFGALAVAFQELQEDLAEFTKLKVQTAEYQLACYPGHGTKYAKHRDAFPDDGNEQNQRRITAIAYMNPEWKAGDGGALRLWPPRKNSRVNHAAHIEHRRRTMEPLGPNDIPTTQPTPHHNGHGTVTFNIPPASAVLRTQTASLNGHRQYDHHMRLHESPRPPHSEGGHPVPMSELDISVSDSDCGSLRSDGIDPGMSVPKSTTSSVMAEIGVHDGQYDVSSIDDLSVASRDHDNARTGIEWVEVGGDMVLEILPVAGRLVMFLSGAVDHAVMPSHNDRVAVTAWYQ